MPSVYYHPQRDGWVPLRWLMLLMPRGGGTHIFAKPYPHLYPHFRLARGPLMDSLRPAKMAQLIDLLIQKLPKP
jgi:hypothetical protein